VGPLAFKFKK